jgi:class 3 adenylate cyclase/tetratricopeptide (TPR) repeat protein
VDTILQRLDLPGANLLDLLRMYESDDAARACWREDARLYRVFARRLISGGHPTRAFELVRKGLEVHPEDQKLKYLGALALKRGGNLQRAGEYVNKLLARGDLEPEIELEALSLSASLEKGAYERTAATQPDPARARRAAELYLRAYELALDPSRQGSPAKALFPGINAATMSFLAGDLPRAKTLAEAIKKSGLAELEAGAPADNYWLRATLAEACLLLGALPEAADWYHRAVEIAKPLKREGDIAAMRANFQLLRRAIPVNEAILGFFTIGNVVAFSGRMIDHPARPTRVEIEASFPPDRALVARVKKEIDRKLDELNARVGFCSAACGADILFAERMIEREAELHIVLPFDLDDFFRTSVDYGTQNDSTMTMWRNNCRRVLDQATQVHYATTEKYLGDDVLFDFANTFIQGLAVLRAKERGVEPYALGVVDQGGSASARVGGTSDFLTKAADRGLGTRVIDLAQLRKEVMATGPPIPAKPAEPGGRVRRRTMVMLFADIENFSRLNDDSYPEFFAVFLDHVKTVLDAMVPAPVFVNTWGDGLYVVFESAVAGAEFALRLVDRAAGLAWTKIRPGVEMAARVGIHAGPVYQRRDPIIDRENVFGSQVVRAARIEPVTTPGCVFASEQFAAALEVEPNHPFVCEYVGIEELAKGYDRCPLYLLRRG